MITLKQAEILDYKSNTIMETFGPLVGTKPVTRDCSYITHNEFVVRREDKYGISYEVRELTFYGSKLSYIIKE